MDLDGGYSTYTSRLLLAAVGCVALFLIQLQNYLLFHSLVELFSILIAFAVFIVAWNARAELESTFLSVLGVAYLFIGGIDLLHTLAYKGMGVFPGYGADLPTQLWILGRYLEAFTLVGAGVAGLVSSDDDSSLGQLCNRLVPGVGVGYTVVTALGLSSIFVFDVFPRAYVEGSGLTQFKIGSEYLIVALLVVALVLLYKQRESFEPYVYRLLVVSILLSTGSELAFTFYVDVYGLSNVVGHLFKFGSFSLIYFAVVQTGITEPQKTLYRTLAAREAEARKFKEAVEHSGHSVVITDRDGVIQYANPAFEEVTGYSLEEVRGNRPSILKSGEHDEAFYEDLWATITAGTVWESEIVNERKDGEQFVVNQTIAPITDEEGTIQNYVAVHMDISERKKQEQELLDRYESLFNSIRDGILMTDTDRRITDVNPAFTDLFGYDLAEIEGQSTRDLYEDDVAFERMGTAIEKHEGDQRFTRTTTCQKKSGQCFPVEVTIFYLRDADGDVVGYIGLIRDITDRENRIQQLQVIDRVLRHNLRNAMNVIEGYATVIRESESGDTAANARQIVATSDDLLKTVSKERAIMNFLTESQSVETIDLAEIVRTIVSTARERHPDADISLSVSAQCSVRVVAPISRAIGEILENAVLHSDQSTPTVSVAVERADGMVEISITDDGPGIPEMERQVLTKQSDIDPLYHGSGLGLWLVTLIVQQSDGTVAFEDNDPRGSVVTIRLPTA
ncbi:MASE3 domain-containing protein [Halorientalis brevis]|uniref:MASE3 domain-containing protein n=1 Tax=Halorientalis brevis TaxID=1126241 RepID=A0ABD6CEZ9_9EURY|nr:MASE3 domain-containing protein [Halorientalis brevis]